MKVRIILTPNGYTNMIWLDDKPILDAARYKVWADAEGKSHVEIEFVGVDVDIAGEPGDLHMIVPPPPPFERPDEVPAESELSE